MYPISFIRISLLCVIFLASETMSSNKLLRPMNHLSSRRELPYFESTPRCEHVDPYDVYSNAVAFSNISKYGSGSLGNNLITIENMVLESIASNCLVLLPTRIIGLPFYAPSCNAFNATQNYSIRKKKCLHKPAEHFYFAKYASTGKLMSDLRHTHSTILESLLKRYLSTDINETHGTVTYLIPIC